MHLYFRRIVAGESVHFGFLMIDPYNRMIKLAHWRSRAVSGPQYDGLAASWLFAGARRLLGARRDGATRQGHP
jgi:hypothetical protein